MVHKINMLHITDIFLCKLITFVYFRRIYAQYLIACFPTCIAACHPDMRTVCRNRKFPLHLRLQFAVPKRKRSRMCSGICHIFFRKIRHCFLQLVMFQCHDILCVINPFDLWDIGVIFSCSRTDRNLDIIRATRSACRRVVHILRLKCGCRGSRRSLTEQGVALSFQIGNTKSCPCRHHSQFFLVF